MWKHVGPGLDRCRPSLLSGSACSLRLFAVWGRDGPPGLPPARPRASREGLLLREFWRVQPGPRTLSHWPHLRFPEPVDAGPCVQSTWLGRQAGPDHRFILPTAGPGFLWRINFSRGRTGSITICKGQNFLYDIQHNYFNQIISTIFVSWYLNERRFVC